MNISNKIIGSVCLLVGTSLAHAATVSISGWEQRHIDSATGIVGTNSGGLTSTVHSFDGTDSIFTFTFVGDLDGTGIANDTFTYDLRLEAYTGSTFDPATGDVTLGTVYDLTQDGAPTSTNQHFGPGFDIDADQSFAVSIENISYVRGEVASGVFAFVDQTFSFDGFTEASRFGVNAANTLYAGEAGAEVLNPAAADIGFTPTTDLVITSAAGSSRVRDLDFSFTVGEALAIPEPTSSLLLGLAGLAFTVRRKRA